MTHRLLVQPHCQSQLISLGRGDHMSRVIAQQEMDDPLQVANNNVRAEHWSRLLSLQLDPFSPAGSHTHLKDIGDFGPGDPDTPARQILNLALVEIDQRARDLYERRGEDREREREEDGVGLVPPGRQIRYKRRTMEARGEWVHLGSAREGRDELTPRDAHSRRRG